MPSGVRYDFYVTIRASKDASPALFQRMLIVDVNSFVTRWRVAPQLTDSSRQGRSATSA